MSAIQRRIGTGRPGGESGRGRRVVGAVATTGLALIALLAAAGPARAAESDFTIYDGAATSPILIDPSYGGEHDDRDYRQVRRAVQDLRQDVAMVTGAIDDADVQRLFVADAAAQAARLASADQSKVPALLTEAGAQASAIIVGQIGESELVDGIIDAGKFDEAGEIEGEWEAYAVKHVDEPVAGVDSALVIAGSDARGTIYGIYSLSERIGVSPYYWYSDVPVEQRDQIVVDGAGFVDDGPDVKYRGIFLNDEERTIEWAKLKFPTNRGTPEVNYYRHVYELMLRLKLNTLWPAMHEFTTSFNAATDTGMYDAGTPVNAEEAAEYGVIMSASHAEMMLRSNVEEWRPFYERNREALNIQGADYVAAFNYSINKPALLAYWRERLVANREFESILALGLRGVHDGAPAFSQNNPYGFGSVVEMVGDAVTEQRKLVMEVYGSVDAVPQVFIPYKEMADLYNNGLKNYIPEDVTLMWAEDNAGYLRQVPTASEAARSGGNGIYYHASYWGSPKSYLWLNSVPMALMVEQFQRAWNSGAGRYWILNVGDIKPGEMKTEMFAKLAWDVDGYDDTNVSSRFLVEHVERDFGLTGADAGAVVDALDRFSRLESTKRAEYWGTQNPSGVHSAGFNGSYSFPFSATSDGDELQRYINEANELVEIVEGVADRLEPRYRSAFYQQVLHRVRSYRNQAQQIGYYWKNQLSAQQGRYGSAKIYAQLSKRARERIRSDEEHWDTLSGGKWDEAIGYSHPITYYGGVNEGIVMLTDDRYAAVASPSDGVGANAEGQKVPGSGTLRFNSASPDDERFFDVFDRNDVAEQWFVEADAPWITLSDAAGTTFTEQRVTVTVDWSQLAASATGTIRVYNASGGEKTGDPVATFTVQAARSSVDVGDTRGHIEANGYVAIEAEHFAENLTGADGSRWTPVARHSQRGDTMKALPETAARVDAGFATSARLTYRVYFTSSGQFTGTFYRVPTLNEGTEDGGTARSSRTAIGLDGAVPTSANLRGCSATGCGSAWANNVMRQIEPLTFTIDVPTPGWHDLVVYRSDAAIAFDRIIIQTVSGAVGDGLVGPVESPNTIAQGDALQRARVAPLPSAVRTYRVVPAVTLSVGETGTVDDIEDVAAVESDNETAVAVELDDGEVTLTGRRVGFAELTLVSRDGGLSSVTVKVQRADGPPLGAYQEEDGLVVIDAADALEKSASADAIDSNNATHGWALARNGLHVVPAATSSVQAHWLATSASQAQALLTGGPSENVNGSAAAGTPPRLEFTVDIENGGTYYLFVNSSSPHANADSYHVAVDGLWRYHSSKGGQETAVETWYGSTSVTGAALALGPGAHTVSVWAREAGFVVNQIALTTTTAPGFTRFQATSERAGSSQADTTPPEVEAVLGGTRNGAGDYVGGATLTLTATDASGVGAVEYSLDGEWLAYDDPVSFTEPGAYTVRYRATDLADPANTSEVEEVTFTVVAGGSCLPPISDEFDGTAVDRSRWPFFHPTTPEAGLTAPTVSDGSLNLPLGAFSVDLTRPGRIGLLGRPLPEGDFTVVTKISAPGMDSDTNGQGSAYAQAGLKLYQSDDNWIKIALTRNADSSPTSSVPTYFELTHEVNGTRTIGTRIGQGTDNLPTWWMRAVRSGTTLTASYSLTDPDGPGGASWVEIGTVPDVDTIMPPGSGPRVIGPYGGNGGVLAQFDYVRFTPDSPSDEGAPETSHTLAPAADGSSGWHRSGPVDVTLEAQDTGECVEGLDRTVYRIDDGDWTEYTEPFTVTADGTHAIEYRSIDLAGNDEQARTVNVRIDGTAPQAAAALDPATPGAGGTYDVPVTVALTASDAGSGVGSIEYRIDGGDWLAYSAAAPPVVSAVGTHTVAHRATDVAGNVSAVGEVPFTIVARQGSGDPPPPPPPGGGDPTPPPPPGGGDPSPPTVRASAAFGSLAKRQPAARLARSGLRVAGSCTGLATGTVRLTVSKRTARKLRLGQKPATLAQARVRCADGRFSATLRPSKKVKRALRKLRGNVAAKLQLRMSGDGGSATATRPLSVRGKHGR